MIFYEIFKVLLSIDVLIDTLCFMVVLLNPWFEKTILFRSNDDESHKNETISQSWQKGCVIIIEKWWKNIFCFYDSIFYEQNIPTGMEKRFMCYWLFTFSIYRIFCIVLYEKQFLVLISFGFLFQSLMFAYEGFVTKTIILYKAKLIVFSFFIFFIYSNILILNENYNQK